MLNWFLDRFFSGRIARRLNPTRRVKLHGIRFTIRKLNPMDYLTGAKALHKIYDTYNRDKSPTGDFSEKDAEKVKNHYRDTLMAGVVSVRCLGRELEPTRKAVDAGEHKLPVDHLITNWGLAEELYLAIVTFTYGKKKLRQILLSQRKSLSSST